MANVDSSDMMTELRKAAKLGFEPVDVKISSFSPSIEVNPKLVKEANIVSNLTRTASGAGTMFTTATGKETYITSATLSIIKDAACDAATGEITLYCAIDGTTIRLLTLPCLTLTAQSATVSMAFPRPIKVDEGAALGLASVTFTAGNLVRSAGVTGFTIESKGKY